jgi:hypothetical protein
MANDLFRLAEALQVDWMSAVIPCRQSKISMDQLIEGFAETCDQAAGRGIQCDLEFTPFPGLTNLDRAWNIVKTANGTDFVRFLALPARGAEFEVAGFYSPRQDIHSANAGRRSTVETGPCHAGQLLISSTVGGEAGSGQWSS